MRLPGYFDADGAPGYPEALYGPETYPPLRQRPRYCCHGNRVGCYLCVREKAEREVSK